MTKLPGRLPYGLIQCYTGDGKGKTTAALGQIWRAIGAGLKVCMVQFIKGAVVPAEYLAAQRFGDALCLRAFAHEFSPVVFGGNPTPADREAAREAWDFALAAIGGGDFDIVALDEIHNALHLGLLDVAEVCAALVARPPHMEIICTGRNAPPELLEIADLITEMRCVRHPFAAGRKARRGIEL